MHQGRAATSRPTAKIISGKSHTLFRSPTQPGTKDGHLPVTVVYLEVWWKALLQFKTSSAPSRIKLSGSLEWHFNVRSQLGFVLKMPKGNVSNNAKLLLLYLAKMTQQVDSDALKLCFWRVTRQQDNKFLHSSSLGLVSCSSVSAADLTWIICTYALLSNWAATLWNGSVQASGLVNGIILLALQTDYGANNMAKWSFWMKCLFVKYAVSESLEGFTTSTCI